VLSSLQRQKMPLENKKKRAWKFLIKITHVIKQKINPGFHTINLFNQKSVIFFNYFRTVIDFLSVCMFHEKPRKQNPTFVI
jgi:hypothetical protein